LGIPKKREDFFKLVVVIATADKVRSGTYFDKKASGGPNIYRVPVMPFAQK
jgi:hypothetical protein